VPSDIAARPKLLPAGHCRVAIPIVRPSSVPSRKRSSALDAFSVAARLRSPRADEACRGERAGMGCQVGRRAVARLKADVSASRTGRPRTSRGVAGVEGKPRDSRGVPASQ
jgi:hypothetical protein